MADETTPPGDEPPEDDLPPTGAHDIVHGDDDDDLPGDRIPSFEEYRRAREESQREGSGPGRGEAPERDPLWFGAGEDGPDDEETLSGGEDGDDEDEETLSGSGGEDGDDEEASPAGAGRYERDDAEDREEGGPRGDEYGADEEDADEEDADEDFEDGGDTLDGEQLEGVELPDDDDEGWAAVPAAGEPLGEGHDFEDELARHAADLFPASAEHTAAEIQERRLAAHRRHRRNGRIRLLLLVAVIALVVAIVLEQTGGGKNTPTPPKPSKHQTPTSAGVGKSYLAANSDPSVLPANLLISDWGGRQLLVVSPHGQIVWDYKPSAYLTQLFNPDYAFFTPSGSEITVTEESHSLIESLEVKPKTVIYTYGHYDVTGSSANRLHDPSAALRETGGEIIAGDIRNCRVIVLREPAHHVARQFGKTGSCTHAPPTTYASPGSAFPLSNGGVVITETSGDMVDLLNAAGKLTKSLPVPGFTLPSDTNEVKPGVLISVDHTHPGAIEIFNTKGTRLWSYKVKHGPGELFLPSFASVLPNGDVLVGDDYNDRVIVIDRQTKKIVWQYGHMGIPSGRKGYLDVPVGLDLVHPRSLLDSFETASPPR